MHIICGKIPLINFGFTFRKCPTQVLVKLNISIARSPWRLQQCSIIKCYSLLLYKQSYDNAYYPVVFFITPFLFKFMLVGSCLIPSIHHVDCLALPFLSYIYYVSVLHSTDRLSSPLPLRLYGRNVMDQLDRFLVLTGFISNSIMQDTFAVNNFLSYSFGRL